MPLNALTHSHTQDCTHSLHHTHKHTHTDGNRIRKDAQQQPLDCVQQSRLAISFIHIHGKDSSFPSFGSAYIYTRICYYVDAVVHVSILTGRHRLAIHSLLVVVVSESRPPQNAKKVRKHNWEASQTYVRWANVTWANLHSHNNELTRYLNAKFTRITSLQTTSYTYCLSFRTIYEKTCLCLTTPGGAPRIVVYKDETPSKTPHNALKSKTALGLRRRHCRVNWTKKHNPYLRTQKPPPPTLYQQMFGSALFCHISSLW